MTTEKSNTIYDIYWSDGMHCNSVIVRDGIYITPSEQKDRIRRYFYFSNPDTYGIPVNRKYHAQVKLNSIVKKMLRNKELKQIRFGKDTQLVPGPNLKPPKGIKQ